MNTALKYDIINDFQDDVMDCQNERNWEEKPAESLSLYELMACDHYVWLKRNDRSGFDLTIENNEEPIVYSDKGIHPYAIKSLAHFCRSFLHSYTRLLDKELEA